jgi:hypothetical protein
VHQADITFAPGADARAPGGAVTIALCGSWDHEGSCRWPHQTSVEVSTTPATVRVVYVVDDEELGHVRRMIESALTSGDDWDTLAIGEATLTADETTLTRRLRAVNN